jgi:hypothetical protein
VSPRSPQLDDGRPDELRQRCKSQGCNSPGEDRREGRGQLRTRLLVRKERESFAAYPYAKKVSHSEREKDVREYLDFLDELTGGSFFAEVIERRDSRSVVFSGTHYAQSNVPSGGGSWDVMPEEERVTTYSGLVKVL